MTRITDVIFDFDGTIVDSAPAILATFKKVLDDQGLVSQVKLDNSLIGPPLAATMSKISGVDAPEKIAALIESFKKTYDDVGVLATHCYAGVREQLESLCEKGFKLHIATNKRQIPTELILDRLTLRQYFDKVYAIDRIRPQYASKSEMIRSLLAHTGASSEEACYVGDRVEDALAAASNQLSFFLASWGYCDSLIPKDGWRVIEAPEFMAEAIASHA